MTITPFQRARLLGKRVLFYSSEFPSPEAARLAYICGVHASGRFCVFFIRDPTLDVDEAGRTLAASQRAAECTLLLPGDDIPDGVKWWIVPHPDDPWVGPAASGPSRKRVAGGELVDDAPPATSTGPLRFAPGQRAEIGPGGRVTLEPDEPAQTAGSLPNTPTMVVGAGDEREMGQPQGGPATSTKAKSIPRIIPNSANVASMQAGPMSVFMSHPGWKAMSDAGIPEGEERGGGFSLTDDNTQLSVYLPGDKKPVAQFTADIVGESDFALGLKIRNTQGNLQSTGLKIQVNDEKGVRFMLGQVETFLRAVLPIYQRAPRDYSLQWKHGQKALAEYASTVGG